MQMGGHASRQTIDIIAAFQHREDPSGAMTVGELGDDAGQFRKALLGNLDASQWIADIGVKAGGDQNEFRPEPVDGRSQFFQECFSVVGICGAPGHGAVKCKAFARPVPCSLFLPLPG